MVCKRFGMRITWIPGNSGELLKLEIELEIRKHNTDYVVRMGRETDRRPILVKFTTLEIE
jgi:hypothetical protein